MRCPDCNKELDTDEIYIIDIDDDTITIGHSSDDCDAYWIYGR